MTTTTARQPHEAVRTEIERTSAVRARRLELGLTQVDVVRLSHQSGRGVSIASLRLIEQTNRCSRRMAYRLAPILGCTVEDLVSR